MLYDNNNDTYDNNNDDNLYDTIFRWVYIPLNNHKLITYTHI